MGFRELNIVREGKKGNLDPNEAYRTRLQTTTWPL